MKRLFWWGVICLLKSYIEYWALGRTASLVGHNLLIQSLTQKDESIPFLFKMDYQQKKESTHSQPASKGRLPIADSVAPLLVN